VLQCVAVPQSFEYRACSIVHRALLNVYRALLRYTGLF